MDKRLFAIVVGIIIAVVGFFYLTPQKKEEASNPSNHVSGAGETGVVLVEYGDFQCPGCGAYFPTVKQVKEKYGDKITFQFRHFPLESIHKNARAAARAAEAAALQGKFWEMHDRLFENQTAWQNTSDPISTFEGYASAIGIGDIAKFTEDYKGSAVNAVINADLAEGRAKNVSATPTFVLNDKVLDPSPVNSVEAFSALIDAAIAEKTGQANQQQTEETQQ